MKYVFSILAIVFIIPFTAQAQTATPGVLQTQMSLDGITEADIKQAKISNNVLTLVLVYRNTSTQEAKITYDVNDVYYIEESENKKYQVLKDEKGKWIGAPINYNTVGYAKYSYTEPVVIAPGAQKAIWFKFPAPKETVTQVNFIIPELLPFEKVPVQR